MGRPVGRYLVKVDVDGRDVDVLRFQEDLVRGADLVVCECTLDRLGEVCGVLMGFGLCVVDLGGLCYYDGRLWQVDVFAVRFPKPWPRLEGGGLDFGLWQGCG